MKKLLIISIVGLSFLRPSHALLPPTILIDAWGMFAQIFALVAALLTSGFMSLYFMLRYKLHKIPKIYLILGLFGIIILAFIFTLVIINSLNGNLYT